MLSSCRRMGAWLGAVYGILVAAGGCNKDTARIERVDTNPVRTVGTDAPEPVATTPAASEQRTPPDDSAITAAVLRQLTKDPGVDHAKLTVRTTAGIVELTGTAENLLSKERAVRIAEDVRGVRTVSDRIELDVPQRDDAAIKRDVNMALDYHAATNAMEITPTAAAGVVTLEGKVNSLVEKEMAERVAKGVSGVRDVRNTLRIDYLAKRTDADIEGDIQTRLRWDALVNGDVAVDVREGKVRLTGEVGSAAQRRRAYSDARVVGVRSIDTSGLMVVPTTMEAKPRASEYVAKPDEELASAIEQAALYDPRVNSFEIDADAKLGVVTLRGQVDNVQAKLAAGSLARHTVGVVGVNNEIQVVPGDKLTDAQKKQRIQAALKINPLTDTYDLGVDVTNGKATLTGTVKTVFESAAAADVAGSVEGVTLVDNNLDVQERGGAYVFSAYIDPYEPYIADRNYLPPTAMRTDTEITREIQDELFWSPFVDSEEVDVRVESGKATLSGTVDSWAERIAASENALEGGAIAVYNQLKVQ